MAQFTLSCHERQKRAVNWSGGPDFPPWPHTELHLWRMDFASASDNLAVSRETLSSDEAERADRFRFRQDRDRFIRARSLLRSLLGRYLAQPPQSLVFEYGPCGKPVLAPDTGKAPLHFNLTHTEDLVLIAVTGVAETGVDAERICPVPDAESVAERFFSPTELEWLRDGKESFQAQRFFHIWTRIEACQKAQGTGLPGLSPGAYPDPSPLSVVNLVSVVSLEAGRDYAAALAICGPLPPIKTWTWNGASV